MSIDFFNRDKSKKDGYRNSCKICQKKYSSLYYSNNKENINICNKKWKEDNKALVSEMSKRYYEENKEKILTNQKEHFQSNKDRIRETKRIYYLKNKDKILKNKSNYIKKRKKDDKLYHLTISIRSLIKSSFRRKKFNSKRTLDIIGCSYLEFKLYIESLFKDGMTWENYGDWHLDHKIPISWATDESDIIRLNHYTNFQPMWAFDNQSKSNKFSN